MAFLPSGDILVAEKGQGDENAGWSHIRLIRGGVLQTDPVITLSTTVVNDSGIFGLVLDPDFEENGYFYVWYATGSDAPYTPPKPVNRLVRLTYDADTGQADPNSYLILLDNITHSDWHNGGGLIFAGDGTLYIATGDAQEEEKTRDLTAYNGKVLHIRPVVDGYEIPEDNPYLDIPGAKREIYAVGLRNPFRMTINTADGELYVGDVGSKMWEELNHVQPGLDYGWAKREGPCPNGQQTPCASGSNTYTDPALYYPHPEGGKRGGAITGIAFYNGDSYPEEYRGKLFFADYDQRYLAIGNLNDDDFTIEKFYDGVDRIVDLEFFRNNLYWLDIRAGAIYMLHYTDSENVAPVARLTADVEGGAAPLAVKFSAADSIDPDDAALTYIWTPGDGSGEIRTNEPVFQHLYSQDGDYSMGLRVADIRGGLSAPVTQEITVYSGEWPTIRVTNLTDPDRTLYYGGDSIHFAAERATGVADLNQDVPYTWRIELLHNEHSHPELVDMAAQEGTLQIPTSNHGGDADLAYRISLSMHTAGGQRVSVAKTLVPKLATIEIASEPAGAGAVLVDNETHSFPHAFDAIVGTHYGITAPDILLTVDEVWSFSNWRAPPPRRQPSRVHKLCH